MTKTIYTTDIIEIKTIKVLCKKCGFAVTLPVSAQSFCLSKCACGTLFPSDYVNSTIKEIHSLQTAVTKDENYSAVCVETETEETR